MCRLHELCGDVHGNQDGGQRGGGQLHAAEHADWGQDSPGDWAGLSSGDSLDGLLGGG